LSGLTYGERIHKFVGIGKITDSTNNIEAELNYNPDASKGMFSSLKKKFWGSTKVK